MTSTLPSFATHPRMLTRSRAAILLASLALAAPALAQDSFIPPPETGAKIVDLRKVGSKYEMRDAATGKLIMQERNCVPETQVFDTQVQRVVEIRPQPAGYDMVVTFTNPTAQALPAGALYAGMFTLGPNVTYYDFRYGSQPIDANFATYVGQQFNYPDSQYSPVWVFMNGEYAVGVSLLYPMLEYQHDARIGLMNPTGSNDGEGGQGWGVSAKVSNRGNEPSDQKLPFSGLIPPGQERTYVLSVRVTNNPGDWVRTLLPYRKFFRDHYGGVTYRREGKPIQPVVIAETSYLEPSNPLGFTYIASRRPDVFGWKPWSDALKQASRNDIQMLWAPSGIYYAKAELNFPFQMTTHWQSTPKLATALDPNLGLKSAADAGAHIGLWWGRSIEVATEWEPSEMVPLDPDNPEHRAAAFREMDLAVQAGVTTVGLDTFNPGIVQLAKLYNWLHDLRQRYPTVKFIVEPNACDMLHSLAGSFISGWKDAARPETPSGLYRVTVPHTLADFLLPGHETFLAFRYNGYRQYFDTLPTAELIEQDIRKFAAIGYTPVLFEDMSTAPQIAISRTWESTIPTDLRLSPAVHPLRGQPALALGDTTRPTERQTTPGPGKAGDGGDSGPTMNGVNTILRTLASNAKQDLQKNAGTQSEGVITSSVNTIGKAAPSSASSALAGSQNTTSSAAQALDRAGAFGVLPSGKSSKGAKSKTSYTPIRVVTSAKSTSRSPNPTQTAGAGGDD